MNRNVMRYKAIKMMRNDFKTWINPATENKRDLIINLYEDMIIENKNTAIKLLDKLNSKDNRRIKSANNILDKFKQIKQKNILDQGIDDNDDEGDKVKYKKITLRQKKIKPVKLNEYTFLINYDIIKKYKKRDGSLSKPYEDKNLNKIHKIKASSLQEAKRLIEYDETSPYGDIPDSWVIISGKTINSVTNIPNASVSSAQSTMSMSMRNASYVNYEFMKDIKYNKDDIYDIGCVPEQLYKRYKDQIKTLTLSKVIDILNIGKLLDQGIDDNDDEGYTTYNVKNFCNKYDISLYAFDYHHKVFYKQISKNNNYKPLVYYAINNHMYLIMDDDQTLQKIRSEQGKQQMTIKSCFINDVYEIENEDIYSNYPIVENYDIDQIKNINISTIIIYTNTNSLHNLFIDIYKHYNIIGNVRGDEANIKHVKFTIKNNITIYLIVDPNNGELYNYKHIMQLCKMMNIPFCNQKFGSVISSFRDNYIKSLSKRKIFNKDERNYILLDQNNKCKLCDKEITNCHIDHIKPLVCGGSNDRNNLQALCVKCHFDKTKNERDNDEYIDNKSKTLSTFNNITNDINNSLLNKHWAFIEQVSHKNNINLDDYHLYAIDINKCRRNILYNNNYKLPVFSCLDDVQIFDDNMKSIKPGLYYIESDNYYPLHGNGWYYHNMVVFCLKKNIIGLSNIKYYIHASLSVDADYFNDFIDLCLKEIQDIDVEDNIISFKKLSVNTLVGLVCFSMN